MGKLLGLTQARFFGPVADDSANVSQVVNARSAQQMLGAHLQQHVDERARLEVLAASKPFIEDVEDGQQPPLRSRAAQAGAGLNQALGPVLLATDQTAST